MKAALPEIAVEAINYSHKDNMPFRVPTALDITMTEQLFRDAASKCPKSALLGGGYLEGAKLMRRTIEALDKLVLDRVAGLILLYGNKTNSGIRNFPSEKLKIYCDPNGSICDGRFRVRRFICCGLETY